MLTSSTHFHTLAQKLESPVRVTVQLQSPRVKQEFHARSDAIRVSAAGISITDSYQDSFLFPAEAINQGTGEDIRYDFVARLPLRANHEPEDTLVTLYLTK